MTGSRATDRRAVRVGDAERDEAARRLGEHYAVGRLMPDEFQDRLGRAYAARTSGDLDVVLGDLPSMNAAAPTRRRRLRRPSARTLAVAGLLGLGLVTGFGADRLFTGGGYPGPGGPPAGFPHGGMHGPLVHHEPLPLHGVRRR